jgi:hypothetical protein
MSALIKKVKPARRRLACPRLIELETDYLKDEEIRVNNQADWYRERIWGELETRETAQHRGF